MSREVYRRWIDGASLAAVALMIRLIWFTGPKLVDDVIYSEAAVELWRQGWPSQDSIFSLRIGFVGLRALAAGILGAGAFSLALPSLVASLSQTVLAYILGLRLFSRGIGVAAGLFLAVNPADVFFATEGHTDLSLAALTSGAFLLIHVHGGSAPWKQCLVAGLLLGVGHLFKEMAIIPVIVLAGSMVVARRPWMQVGALLATYGAVPFLEGLGYLLSRGEFFHRFLVVRSGQQAALFSPVYLETVPTARRILLDFPSLLLNPANVDAAFAGLVGWWMLASTAALLIARRRVTYPLLGWAVGVLALMNFLPVSLFPYRPAMVAYPWLLVHLSVPVALASAVAFKSLMERSRPFGWVVGASTVLASLVCVHILHSDVQAHQDPIRAVLDQLPAGSAIVTDPRTLSLMRVYKGFPEDSSLGTWNGPRPTGEWYYVENPFWLSMLSTRYGESPPEDLRIIAANREVVFTVEGRGRLRWRALLKGRVERTAWPPVKVYRGFGP